MSTVTTSGAAAAAIANAIKASGAIVRVEPAQFLEILARVETPLVIISDERVFFARSTRYLTSYRGFIFYAKSATPLDIPAWCEVVNAKSVWIPG